MDTYYAHSIEGQGKKTWQALGEHLSNVARLSGTFAEAIGLQRMGTTAGMLHDIGKASRAFQARLEGSPQQVDHSSAGAIIVWDQLKEIGLPLAYVIAGHHSGLSNGTSAAEGLVSLKTRLEKRELIDTVDASAIANARDQLTCGEESISEELTEFIKRGLSGTGDIDEEGQFQVFLLTKVLYSCLVDADYLDSESCMAPQISSLREKPADSIDELIEKYESYMRRLCDGAPDNELNACRRSVRNQCLTAARNPQGFFTLHVPTGGGKTLSVVGFALTHAKERGLRRIIIALPYTNLIEQTADVMRRVFGARNVLEHHSNYDFEAVESDRGQYEKLATQNWDAPIIVTTNVQLFESLYSNKPGKSRKIHNIAGSVLILDEAQSLPDNVLKPTLAMLEMLVRSCGVTCVLCTATQPYFKDVWPFGETPREIVANREGFEKAFGNRTYFESIGTLDEVKLADRLISQKQTLCIVGNKTEAREIYRCVISRLDDLTAEESCFCLSTNKTPSHRSQDLKKIKRLLFEKRQCYVISTQLIEAGVDIDFPVVYRELAGIDSLFQAAGRCNREGTIEKPAPVYIFECLKDDGILYSTTPWLAKQREISRSVLREMGGRLGPEAVEPFFKIRYSNSEELDAHGILGLICKSTDLESSLEMMPFAKIAEEYRLISDETIPVFVRWGDGAEKLYRKMQDLAEPGILARSAQQYSLALRGKTVEELKRSGYIEEIPPFLVLDACDGCRIVYDEEVGLRFGEEELLTLIG